MKLSNNYLALMLLGVVVLAGCVGQPSGGAGAGGSAGIVISELLASPPQVYSGGSVVVSANLKNLGQSTPTKVTASIFGLESWSLTTTNQNLQDSLIGADPTIGQQGGETTAVWTGTAPSKDVVVSYPFIVRVTYDYTTKFNGVMKAVTGDYYRQTNEQGGVVSQSFTSGPLSIAVKVPSVIAPASRVPIQFGSSKVTCSGDAVLGGGTKTIISCSVDASAVTTTSNIDLGLTLTYNYYVDAAQTVTILPIVGTSSNLKSLGEDCTVGTQCQSGKCDTTFQKCIA
jgi:Tfp pilus assembly major pilin PilA